MVRSKSDDAPIFLTVTVVLRWSGNDTTGYTLSPWITRHWNHAIQTSQLTRTFGKSFDSYEDIYLRKALRLLIGNSNATRATTKEANNFCLVGNITVLGRSGQYP